MFSRPTFCLQPKPQIKSSLLGQAAVVWDWVVLSLGSGVVHERQLSNVRHCKKYSPARFWSSGQKVEAQSESQWQAHCRGSTTSGRRGAIELFFETQSMSTATNDMRWRSWRLVACIWPREAPNNQIAVNGTIPELETLDILLCSGNSIVFWIKMTLWKCSKLSRLESR